MGTNKELVLPFLEAMIAAGVPAENITVLEQYGEFLAGTRINAAQRPGRRQGRTSTRTATRRWTSA